jgi:hypothetical protein
MELVRKPDGTFDIVNLSKEEMSAFVLMLDGDALSEEQSTIWQEFFDREQLEDLIIEEDDEDDVEEDDEEDEDEGD